ncbi:copper resistance CopC family protein [Agromyces albus]|uniref:Copper resistance protein CopC n=1 Tax=Agromyces albus TaxID=205332 RepID=A0A4Q2KYP9_9MICO|nr:copper resistance CopC family protein [Agromyces albus]RXZ68751.1 copper resistance protein CopC [Agromyces albus]
MTNETPISTAATSMATSADAPADRARRLRALVLAGAALTAAALFALADTSPALAHDELIGSSPEQGEVLDASPEAIGLSFSNDIIEVGTTVVVVDHHGEEISVEEPVIAGSEVTVELPADLSGDYQVRWRAVSSDGHPIEGTIDFGVGAEATGVWEEQPPHTDDADGADADGENGGTDEQADDAAASDAGVWLVVAIVAGSLLVAALIAGIITSEVRRRRRRNAA